MEFHYIFIWTLIVMWGLFTLLLAKLLSLPKEQLLAVSSTHAVDFGLSAGFLLLNLVSLSNVVYTKMITKP